MRIIFLKLLYPLLSLASFINPFYGILNYAFITVIRPESLSWGASTIKYVSLSAIACLLVSSLAHKVIKSTYLFSPFFISFLMFYGFLSLSTYLSPTTYLDPFQHEFTFSFLKQLFIIFVYCVCLYSVLSKDIGRIDLYVNGLLLFFVFMALWGVQQRLLGNMLVEGLFGSAIKDRCAITGIFVLYFPVALFSFLYPYKQKKFWRAIGGAGILLFATMVFLTDSRAGFLGFVFCCLVLSVSMKNKVRNIIVLIMVLVFTFAFLPEEYQNRMMCIGKADEENNEIDYSAGARLLLWNVGISIFKDSPLLGVGNLNFPEVAYSRRGEFVGRYSAGLLGYAFQENFKLQCHNMFINILAEGGLLSAIPFYAMIIIPIFSAWRLRKKGKLSEISKIDRMNKLMFFLNAGLLGYLVTCVFSNMRFIDYYYWHLTLLLVVTEIIGLADLNSSKENLSSSDCSVN